MGTGRSHGRPAALLTCAALVRIGNGPLPMVPPLLARVPVSLVSRGQQYDEGATTSRLRVPGRLFASLPRSTRSSVVRARLAALPARWRTRSRPGHLFNRLPRCRCILAWTRAGSHRFQAIHPMPLPRSETRPDRRSLTATVPSMLPPLNPQRRLQRSQFRG
jgi:hypothetical protein